MRGRRLHLLAAAAVLTALAGCGSAEPASEVPEAAPPAQRFVTRPDLRPPEVRVVRRTSGTAPGLLFLAPKKEVDQAGPLILDDAGEVVWFRPLDTKGVTDFRVQRYRGRPVLTWWRGQSEKGVGNGHYVVLDDRYREVARVRAGNGLNGDIHEFLITPRDTALITIYHDVRRDLRPYGGPENGTLKEGVVQEIDIESGRVLFEWHSAEHVDPAESYHPLPEEPGEAWDYFHVNSVEPDGDRLLVSARHTGAVYAIDRDDGAVAWRLGGKRSDFRHGPGTRFAWQHDARRQADGTVTLFDNAAAHPGEAPESRVLVLRVDERRRVVELVRSYGHAPPLLSTSQANAQLLPNGNVLVGWGSNEVVTEFAAGGRVLLDLRFGAGGSDSYRAYRFPWRGSPDARPAVAARAEGDATAVYASWNGATDVASWRVLAGGEADALRPVATVPRDGFETRISVEADGRVLAVEALDAGGSVLRRSDPVELD